MGAPKKVTLKTILCIPEINPRDPEARGSKARSLAIETLGEDSLKAMTSGVEDYLKETAQGLSLSGFTEPLLVAPLPTDLPRKYLVRAQKCDFVLVDGYQRYEAIDRSIGSDVRVPVKVTTVETMSELIELALTTNLRNSLPLAESEKRAHVFRLLLLGYFDEGIDKLHKRYPGGFGRSNLGNYMKVAKIAREEAGLSGLPPGRSIERLKDKVRAALYPYYDVELDTKGYPTYKSVKLWTEVMESGDITKLMERKKAEEERRQVEREAYRQSLSVSRQGVSPEVRRSELNRELALLEQELNERADENFG